jgi:hypothetical protein
MNLRDGEPPPFERRVTEQSQYAPIFEFIRSTDLTCLLTAACVAIGAMIVICAASGPAVTGVDSVATAMAFG